MNRNQAKVFSPIIQAFAEGKVIECRTRTWELNKGWQYSTNWKKTEELKFQDTYEYRIKPEPKCRPFKDAEECWNEMQKHQPVGWVKQINGKGIEVCIHCGVIKGDWILTAVDEVSFPFDGMYNNYTFVDGTPFGIKEEE